MMTLASDVWTVSSALPGIDGPDEGLGVDDLDDIRQQGDIEQGAAMRGA